ncbi:MAG: hypothetical protein ACOYW3_15225 [Bacteroidota bacterium]
MKARLFNLILVGLMLSGTAAGQHFWVIETNPNVNATQFRIYDERSMLVHEEKITGWRLDVRFKADRKLLNRKMKTVLGRRALASTRRATRQRTQPLASR